MRPRISIRGFVRPSVRPLVGPWWSSWKRWKCIESSKYLRLLHHSVDSWLVHTPRITLHHSTWLMQYCIILNKLSRMWTHRRTQVLVFENLYHDYVFETVNKSHVGLVFEIAIGRCQGLCQSMKGQNSPTSSLKRFLLKQVTMSNPCFIGKHLAHALSYSIAHSPYFWSHFNHSTSIATYLTLLIHSFFSLSVLDQVGFSEGLI